MALVDTCSTILADKVNRWRVLIDTIPHLLFIIIWYAFPALEGRHSFEGTNEVVQVLLALLAFKHYFSTKCGVAFLFVWKVQGKTYSTVQTLLPGVFVWYYGTSVHQTLVSVCSGLDLKVIIILLQIGLEFILLQEDQQKFGTRETWNPLAFFGIHIYLKIDMRKRIRKYIEHRFQYPAQGA